MSPTNPPDSATVVYCAPSSEVLKAFARTVCQRLGTPYVTPEVMLGFSTFIEVVATIEVQTLNRGGGDVDKPVQTG